MHMIQDGMTRIRETYLRPSTLPGQSQAKTVVLPVQMGYHKIASGTTQPTALVEPASVNADWKLSLPLTVERDFRHIWNRVEKFSAEVNKAESRKEVGSIPLFSISLGMIL